MTEREELKGNIRKLEERLYKWEWEGRKGEGGEAGEEREGGCKGESQGDRMDVGKEGEGGEQKGI